MKRLLVVFSILGVLAAGSGCCELQALLHRPFGCEIAICDPPACGGVPSGPPGVAPCGEVCGPVCEPECAVPCDPCGDPCGAYGYGAVAPYGPYYGSNWPGLLPWLWRVLFGGGFCGDGCGELYWSEWHSDPPDCSDPCDRCGNWTAGWCASRGNGYAGVPDEGYMAGNSSSAQAPRVISVTDHAVSPAPAQPQAAPQAVRPRAASPRR
jgi:hypothetical protein